MMEEKERIREEDLAEERDFLIEKYESDVLMEEYLEDCVDVPQFLEYCKQCHNYDKTWSCPSFDFDPVEYLKKYRTLRVIGWKIIIPEEYRLRIYPNKEQNLMMENLLAGPKRDLDREMLNLEKEYPGSRALSGGSCLYCKPSDCAKVEGKPCRFPEKMRYSIEALGGNVGLTVTRYLGQKLEWIEEGRLPRYFMLVAGLLIP